MSLGNDEKYTDEVMINYDDTDRRLRIGLPVRSCPVCSKLGVNRSRRLSQNVAVGSYPFPRFCEIITHHILRP